jgi:hypothetical protein
VSRQTLIKLLTGTEWMARGVLKEILWEVADSGEAMDRARELGEGDSQLCARVCVCMEEGGI